MFQNIVWSAKSCTLEKFVDNFTLPQLVKVEDGFYSEDDAKTLSAEQILTLHVTKRTDKVLVKAAEGTQYFIPLACPSKVEILPRICDDRYYSVEDIVDASISGDLKFIRVIHDGPPSFHIRAGDILKLKKTSEQNRVRFLECEFHDKTRDIVKLPLDFQSAFEPLASAEQYHLQEVLKSFKLPVRVKFTSCDTIIQDASNNDIDLKSLGSVLLKELREESTIIATTRDDNLVTVLMIPTDLDVNVIPALGAVTGDKEYARFCRDIHDGTELTKVDLLNDSKLTEFYDEPTVDVVYDYVEVKPMLPPRGRRLSSDSGENYERDDGGVLPPGSRKPTNDNSDSSGDDYEVVDLPPPRPPKPLPKPKPKPKPTSPSAKLNLSHYQNIHVHDFKEASPHGDDGNYDDNEDDDADNPYLDDSDYIYPDDELEPTIPRDSEPKAQQEKLDLRKKPGKLSLNLKRLSEIIIRKTVPKSSHPAPSVHSQGTSDATVSAAQGPFPTPASPTASSSLSTATVAAVQRPNPTPPAPTASSVSLSTATVSAHGPVPTPPWTDSTSLSTSPAAAGPRSSLEFPDDLRSLSVSEIGECLKKLKMGQYVETFEHNQIDGELFITVDQAMLAELGVSRLNQRKLLKFIKGWRPNTN